MKATSVTSLVLGLMLTMPLGSLPKGVSVLPDGLVVAQLPHGEVAEGVPVKEWVEKTENPVADQAEGNAEARQPRVHQPGVDTPMPDVDAPPDVVQPPDEEP